MKRSTTDTLIKALRILARDIESGDGVANAAIAEAADRLEQITMPDDQTFARIMDAMEAAILESDRGNVPYLRALRNAYRAAIRAVDP